MARFRCGLPYQCNTGRKPRDLQPSRPELTAALDRRWPFAGAPRRSGAAAQLRVILSIWITTTGVGLDTAMNSMISNLAKAMENPTSLSYSVAAVWASQIGRYDEAFDAIAKAQALAPNDADVLASKARILLANGKAAEAEGAVRLAMRLDPSAPAATLRILSMVLFQLERYDEALEVVGRINAKGTITTDDYLTTVASLGHLGRKSGRGYFVYE